MIPRIWIRWLAAAFGPLALLGCAPGPQMVRLPAGQFRAGSAPAETAAVHYPEINAAREQPIRTVTVSRAFAIGRYEVTRGEFARFVAATGWNLDGPCSFLDKARGAQWAADAAHDWRNPGFAQTDRHPVVCVNLGDAIAYADWLSVRTGHHYRLPSNTEWEYAARAGTATAQWWGPAGNPCKFANLADTSFAESFHIADREPLFACTDGFSATAPVGSFAANRWGLNDMLGNVWEWTLDCLNETQLGALADISPRLSGDCGAHIDRGASWGNSRKYVRAAAQHPDLIGARTAVLGFRLVEDLR